MGNFYTDVIQADARFHATEECRDLAMLEPVTRAAVTAIVADAAAQGIELFVTETFRSAERQEMLYARGATQLHAVGVHHFGLAADFAKMIDGRASWGGDWEFLCKLAVAHGCISGGDWGEPAAAHSFRDFDHVQRCTLAQQPGLFSGSWYPTTPAAPAEAEGAD
jgi:peptidoglycan L-alanyl-D-glutamate endopeptidase CwlK